MVRILERNRNPLYQLPIEIYTDPQNSSIEKFRKNSLPGLAVPIKPDLSKKPPSKNHDPILTPTPKKEKGLLLTTRNLW